jgi:hypothetical protein
MIELPDFDRQYEYETYFHLTLDVARLGKLAAHYEAYRMVREIPGAIIECGVFKGTSITRFAMLRDLFDNPGATKIIGFDGFGDEYPDTAYEQDHVQREKWIREAGSRSISKEQLELVFDRRRVRNFELVAGDILETLPAYVRTHPELKVSLLNIDIDFVEPTLCALTELYDLVMPGGIILLDNYGAFHGDTKGVDTFFEDRPVTIKRFPFVDRPCYIVKKSRSD